MSAMTLITSTGLFTITMLKNSRFCLLGSNIFCRLFTTTEPGKSSTPLTVLGNGVKVATLATEQRHSPLACISMFVEAGPRFESASNNGITHMVEHMAYKGSKATSQDGLESEVSAMSGQLSVRTLRDMQVFTAKCPAECAPKVVDIFSKILLGLSIDDAKVEEEKQKMFLEMGDADTDPRAVTFDYLHQTAFQGTSLAQPVIGPSHNIRKFDATFIESYILRQYRPQRIVIATAGDVSHDEMVCITQSTFGSVAKDACCETVASHCRFTGSQIVYRDDSMPFVHVAIAVEAPGYCSPEFLTMFVANCMIGSWDKTQGPHLGMPLAEASSVSHLCESYQSFYIPYRDVGLWGIYFVSKKMDAEDFLLNVQDQWMKLCLVTRPSDVERGKCFAKLKLARGREGVVNTSMDIGTQLMYTGGRKSLHDLCRELGEVKVDDIKNACDKYIYDRCPAVAAVGPTEALSDYTRIRAGMYWLRL